MRGWLAVAFTVALLQVPLSPATGDDGVWVLEDDAEDLVIRFPTGVPDQPAPVQAKPWMDIRKVTMGGEDETGFGIDIEVQDLPLVAHPRSNSAYCFFPDPGDTIYQDTFILDFEISAGFAYRIGIVLSHALGPTGSHEEIEGSASCLIPRDETYTRSQGQLVPVVLDGATKRLHVWVPKTSLLGENPVSGSPAPDENLWPERVEAGLRIQSVRVQTMAELGTPPGVPFVGAYLTDWAPETGESPVFTLTKPTANDVVTARFEGGKPRIPVSPDANQSLDLWITNGADGRRIISLDYELLGPEDRLPHYAISGPERVTLPAGETRRLQVALKVAPEARAGDNVSIEVRAESAGFPNEVGYALAMVVPAAPVSPEANRLYFHAAGRPGCGLTAVAPCYYTFLSPLERDPEADFGPRVRLTVQPFFPAAALVAFSGATTLGDGTPLPVLLDPVQRVKFQAVLEVPTKVEGAVAEFSLSASNGTGSRTVAEGEVTFDAEAPVTTVNSEARVFKSADSLSRGTRFTMSVRFVLPPTGAAWYGGFYLRTVETFVELPVLDLPEELQSRPATSSLQLDVLGSREEFVNPGKTRLFNLTLLNQGGATSQVALGGRADAPEWNVRFEPSDRFTLEPGDFIRVGLLVSAPADAAEGDGARILVNATDATGQRAETRVRLTAVQALDIPDDSDAYRADQDAVEKAVRPPAKKTPAPDALAVALVGLAAVLVAARRR